MPQFADRVKTTSTSTGSSAITLSSSSPSGYQAFPSSLDGETVGYVIESGTDWEIGTGVYTHSSLGLSRTLRSSSTGSLLNLGSGTHTVFLTPAAQDLQIVEAFSSTSDLPSASASHGRIYHVHGEGAMYFAHGGSWHKLANATAATTSADGLMSAADKTKLDGIETSADATDTTNVVAALTAGTNITIAADGTISSTASGGGGSTASALTEQEFTATAGQTVFTVTDGITNADNVVVFLNGSRLFSTDVTVSDTANTVTLAAGATVGDLVTVSEFGAAFGSQYSSTIFTVGTSSEYNTTSKVLTTPYTANKVAVYLNGVKLLVGTDCTATNGTSIDLTNAAPVTGDKIEVVEHGALADSVTTLTGLSDTPSSLGTAGQVLQVNSGANALEFADASGGGSGVTSYTGKSGTDGTPSGATYIDNVSNPSEGSLAFDEDKNVLYIRAGSAWERVQHGGNAGPRFTTTPASTLELNSDGSTSTLTAVAVDEGGFPVTYDWDAFSGSTVYTASSMPNQLTNVSESNGVFTLTPSTTDTHAGTFTFRTKASDGAQVSIATTSVELSFTQDITTPNTSPFNSAGTNSFNVSPPFSNNSGSGLSDTLSTGKKYFEIVIGSPAYAYAHIGLCDATVSSPGYKNTGVQSIYAYNSKVQPSATTTNLTDFQNTGDILMIAYDTSTREVWFGVNGSWYEDPSTTSSSFTVGTSSTTAFKIMFGNGTSTATYSGTINVGSNVNYTVPTGFQAH